MKKASLFVTVATLSIPWSIAFAGGQKMTCVGSQDYYPTEIIAAVRNEKVLEVLVKVEEGEVGPFIKNSKLQGVFSSTSDELIINSIVTFSDDLTTATYTVVYKNSGEVLSSESLVCK